MLFCLVSSRPWTIAVQQRDRQNPTWPNEKHPSKAQRERDMRKLSGDSDGVVCCRNLDGMTMTPILEFHWDFRKCYVTLQSCADLASRMKFFQKQSAQPGPLAQGSRMCRSFPRFWWQSEGSCPVWLDQKPDFCQRKITTQLVNMWGLLEGGLCWPVSEPGNWFDAAAASNEGLFKKFRMFFANLTKFLCYAFAILVRTRRSPKSGKSFKMRSQGL